MRSRAWRTNAGAESQSSTVPSATRPLNSSPFGPTTPSETGGTVRGGGGGLGEVTITLTNGDRSQITTSATNPAGAYSFSGVPEGAYTLTFVRTGYATQVVLVRVSAGLDTTSDVSMVAG